MNMMFEREVGYEQTEWHYVTGIVNLVASISLPVNSRNCECFISFI